MRVFVWLSFLLLIRATCASRDSLADFELVEMAKDEEDAEENADEKSDTGSIEPQNLERAITEEEISYIANTLEPRECLSLLYALRRSYKRRKRRRRRMAWKDMADSFVDSTHPCEKMLLNFWQNPRYRDQRDCSKVSLTLRAVKRQDLANWLMKRSTCAEGVACPSLNVQHNVNETVPPNPQVQLIPTTHPSTVAAAPCSHDNLCPTIPWLYVGLAVSATASLLLCAHYLTRNFRKATQYIALANKSNKSAKNVCDCKDKEMTALCNKKKKSAGTKSGYSCSYR